MSRWFAMSTQYLSDPRIEALGEAHGPGGPLLIVALLGQAKIQEKGGSVKRSYRTLAHETFVDREAVLAIVSDAEDSGLVAVDEQDDQGVTVRFLAWDRWQAAARQAKSRENRKAASQAKVTDSHDLSRDVTNRHTDKTGQDKQDIQTDTGKPAVRSLFPEWLDHYRETTGRTSVTGSKPAREAFAARIKDGKTLDELKLATVGCHGDQFCRENGHDVPETILRASKVERYISLARDRGSKKATSVDQAHHFAQMARDAEAEERAAA